MSNVVDLSQTGNPIAGAQALVDRVEQLVDDGALRPGDRLPPVRAAGAQLGLNPNTVASAYRTLGDRGTVISEGRRGTFVAARPALAGSAVAAVPAGLLDLASGNPDPALLPPIDPYLSGLRGHETLYGAPNIDPLLSELLRAALAADGIDAEHLAVVGGALDGIERVLGAQLRPGDRVAIEDPGYSSVRELVLALGLKVVPVAVDHAGPDPEALAVALAGDVAAVIVTSRAHNPTGAAIDPTRAAALRAVLAEHPDVLVVEDDHAGPVAGQPFEHLVAPERARWATVRSLAKAFGPDLRLAAVAGDRGTISRVIGRQVLGAGWVSHILQQLAAAMLADPEVPERLARAEATYRDRRTRFVERLAGHGVAVTTPSGLNVWIPVVDEAAVVVALQQRGIAVRAGAPFRIKAAPGVRVSVAAATNDVLDIVADHLSDVVTSSARVRSG
ncbi:MAG: aminotransferase class I/II-fold pyridoxal phosphate-dependent enzyme [Actinomycetota bacterium]